jgi:uncharacterized protein
MHRLDDFIRLIRRDQWMMEILWTANSMNLLDWWVCAGFVRSKIWDVQHGYTERTPIPDIDVIYFDQANIDEAGEKQLEDRLRRVMPDVPWSVKNEARMHLVNNIPPYSSAVDAISKFPETATALGVKMDDSNNLVIAAPHGIDDVMNLTVRPTPYFLETEGRIIKYKERIRDKNWKVTWPKLDIAEYDGQLGDIASLVSVSNKT